MYVKGGRLDLARTVFDEMGVRNSVARNAIVDGHLWQGYVRRSRDWLLVLYMGLSSGTLHGRLEDMPLIDWQINDPVNTRTPPQGCMQEDKSASSYTCDLLNSSPLQAIVVGIWK
ncbi:hypothetical protein MLD38_040235 [Melastoma candidum]|uniref:Uncharacterized protein n=1 Tax=Melastoma candidum TaxID=119954 RepID=A0ACB9L5F4_9MYRT|nr:hypothetical protein MLD38_040235 [Melastoma candidum]